MTEKQGTQEWHAARLGKVTASRVADIVRKIKNGTPSAMRANYMAELVCERLTGVPYESYTSKEMEWGKDKEAQAREDYELYTDSAIELVGFIDHPRIAFAGASPDGLVGSDGLVEFKCPNTATHLAALEGASIEPDYIKQMQWQMAVTERKWCDFVSYDPRLPVEMQIHIRRVERDPHTIMTLEGEVRAFLKELEQKITALQERHGMIGGPTTELAFA